MVALAPEVGLARDKFRLMNEPTEARLRAVEGAKNMDCIAKRPRA